MKLTYFKSLFLASFLLVLSGCTEFLEEEVYTQYAPEEFLNNEDGIQKVLIGAYSQLQVQSGMREDQFTLSEFPTDITLESGGQFEKDALPFINFQWDASSPFFLNIWARMYRAIRNANVLLDNIDKITAIAPARLIQYKSEARFIRAEAYTHLHRYFGAVPLILSTNTTEFQISRPTDAEFNTFVTTELTEAAQNLPVQQNARGKADKGTALAVLCKFYLNTKQWQKSAETAQQIIGLGKYSLFGSIETLFTVDNEANNEFIFVYPCVAQAGYSNNYMPHAFPPNYPIQTNWINYGAQFRTYTKFVKSFHPNDRRLKMIITQYTDTKGVNFKLVEDAAGKALDNARSFKYVPDPNAVSENNGNDIPVIRYADILLSRAEALNEISGPTQESINLINQVRKRAGVPDILLSNFTSKESLREHLLNERAWELFTEGKRREDLIRMGKFVSSAIERGKSAKAFHVLYPLPQSEIDANSKLKQNDGY